MVITEWVFVVVALATIPGIFWPFSVVIGISGVVLLIIGGPFAVTAGLVRHQPEMFAIPFFVSLGMIGIGLLGILEYAAWQVIVHWQKTGKLTINVQD